MIRGAQQTFDVASVKANTSSSKRASMQMNLPDGFTTTNQTLQSLISIVYQVPVYRMSGGPDWLRSETFDINAKADHRITLDEKRQMIRALLEDRFKLKTHRENRDGRIYALVLARRDGTLGPDLKPSTLDCASIIAERQRTGAAPRPTPDNPVPACGSGGDRRGFHGNGIQIGSFAATLGAAMREMIVDETGLTAWWDLAVAVNFTGLSGPGAGADVASDQPSVFTALQEQLGLKLEPRRGPVEFFVIDSAERPTSD